VIQLADAVASVVWSFVLTYLILTCMWLPGKLVPALRLRVSNDQEEQGVDDAEISEFAYNYVERTREVKASLDEDDGQDAQSVQDLNRPAVMRPDKAGST
jgi:Amt family ammonium transporter